MRLFAYYPIISAAFRTISLGMRIIIYRSHISIFREYWRNEVRVYAANLGYFATYYSNGNISIQRENGGPYIEWIYTTPIPYTRTTFCGLSKIKLI